MKKRAFCLVLLAMVLVGCTNTTTQSSSVNPQSTENGLTEIVAITKAKNLLGINGFPDQPSKVEGIIQGGGPSPGIKVPGEFETKVEKDGDSAFIVTFMETWNAKDFHYSGQNGPTLSHFFKYKVTPRDVQRLSEGGDFPPQSVR